jgi:ATP-binding cassette subfamily F protein 3
VKLGYYDQNHEDLNPLADILTEVHQARSEWTPEQVRSFLGKFLFTGQDAFQTINTLSGGELSRVAMARLILSGPNVLLLDEPTNHLDIASREALEAALIEYPGAIIMVSHDRALIDRIVDKIVIIERGRAEIHPGNYSDYRWKFRERLQEAAEAKSAEDVLRIRRESAPAPAPAPAPKAEKKKGDRKSQRRVEELEAEIERLESEVRSFDGRFAACDPADYGQMQALKAEFEAKQARLLDLYSAWESLTG